jgi:hypothetical protein
VIEGIEGLLGDEETAAAAAILGQGNAELAAAVEQNDADPDAIGVAGTVPQDITYSSERPQP